MPTPVVDLGSIQRDTKLMIARIGAIEGYANVEQSLCSLFSSLLGSPIDRAAIVFFRITNTHSRNFIIESLLAKQHGSKYNPYWYGDQKNGLINLIRQLDGKRNEIVHWHTQQNIHFAEDSYSTSELLVPPNVWAGSSASISTDDLLEYIAKADFVQRSINMFNLITINLAPQIPVDVRDTWLQIFAQPVTYPPGNTHPLSSNYKG